MARPVPTLEQVAGAIYKAWSPRTCRKPRLFWPMNPGWGQDDVTAVLLRRLFGGSVIRTTAKLSSDVKGADDDAPREFRHYYNVLEDGRQVDLTRFTFPKGTIFDVHAPDEPAVRGLPFTASVVKRAVLLERLVYKRLGMRWEEPAPPKLSSPKPSVLMEELSL